MTVLNLPSEYTACFEIISKRLGDRLPRVTLTFDVRNEMTVGFDGNVGYIRCDGISRFARLLGIFSEKYRGEAFEIRETPAFGTVGCMLDLSFGSAPTKESIYAFLEYAALLGYNQVWLYMEDMYEIKERAHFGYLRGRYTFDELRAIDGYAYSLGIEAVPCIQTLGHLKNYLCWPEAESLKDGPQIMPMNLLADSEETYDFIERMIVNSSSPFRTKRIHIGCDETAGLGLGKYLELYGFKDQFEIYVRHVKRVIDICKKHALSPMMWGDMLIAYSSDKGDNYDVNATVCEKVKSAFDKTVDIVFWHYGQRPGCEDALLDKYSSLTDNPIFAGGVRSWQSPLPDNYFSFKAAESSLGICKKKGVREVILTLWTYVTTIYQATYLALCHFAELSYNDTSDGTRERFEFLSGASYDAFIRMSDFNALYDSEEAIMSASYSESGRGNNYYICDILLNTLESDMLEHPRSAYYKGCAEFFEKYAAHDGEWKYLYAFSHALFDTMATKCEIVEGLTPAYKKGDCATLREIKDTLLPRYLEGLERIGRWHSYHKDSYLRPFGTENRDQVLGGMKERAKTAIRRIGMYLDGKIGRLDELDEAKLPYSGGPLVTVVPKLYY